jgi:hypothetical protein
MKPLSIILIVLLIVISAIGGYYFEHYFISFYKNVFGVTMIGIRDAIKLWTLGFILSLGSILGLTWIITNILFKDEGN